MRFTSEAFVLVRGRVLAGDAPLAALDVVVEDGRIVGVLPSGDPSTAGLRRHDLGGALLLPGFIDSQCNGGGGVLFNSEPTVGAIRRIAAAHRGFGTTGFLPTLISDTPEVMHAAVAAVAQAMREGVPGVLGIHLEGPFLNAARKGVHDSSKFRAPDADELLALCAANPGVTVLTLAPETASPEFIARMVEAGVVLSAGHTAADHGVMSAALAGGVRGVTHLFNAMTPLTSRAPGAVGAALDDPDCWCGVIVDGHHVHPTTLRIAIAAKPAGKVMLVTDAMPPVGAEMTEYVLDGRTIRCADGVCKDDDGVLAGSMLDMATAVRNTVSLLGLPLDEAARMASAYPADFLRLGGVRGRIAAGLRADFVVLDDELHVRETWIGGIAYPGAASGHTHS